MEKTEKLHKYLIPGLDYLIGNPDALTPTANTKLKAEYMIIPDHYTRRCGQFRDELSTRGEAAKILVETFAHSSGTMYTTKQNEYECENGMKIIFQKEIADAESLIPDPEKHGTTSENFWKRIFKWIYLLMNNQQDKLNTSDYTVLAAKWFIENAPFEDRDDLAILTGDNMLVTTAYRNNIDVAHVNPDVYYGRRALHLTEVAMDIWCKKGYLTQEFFEKEYPDEPPLSPNEFVLFEPNDNLETTRENFCYYIGRFHKFIQKDEDGVEQEIWAIRRIHYIEKLPKFIQLRTPGQAMFAEALLAPPDEIPIVICPSTFGTGKTFLATAIGAQLTIFNKQPTYESIFVCPRDSELGKEIGYLPGSETDKTIAKAMPILDNFESYLKLRKDKEKDGKTKTRAQLKKDATSYREEYFEFVSVVNMGGRSLTDRFIIYDEAQELERFQINQLMKRIGENSKLVIMGDPMQIYNRHLNKHSNGLSYAATKMRGSEYAAIISMLPSEITRSVAAMEIAKMLD